MKSDDLSRLKIDRTAHGGPVRRRRNWLRYGVAALVVAAAAAWGWNRFAAPPSVETATVAAVYPSQSYTILNAAGYVVPERKAALSSKASGRLEWLGVQEGSRVKSGEVIARLDNQDVGASRDSAVANLGVAKANLEQGEAELFDAEHSYKRAQDLYNQKFIAESALDSARARYEKARASISSLRASIRVAEAQARAANVAVDQTLIRAPFDGYVQQRMVSVGELVKVQMPVMTVVRVNPLKLLSEIPERMAPWVKVGQPLTLSVDAFPDKKFAATISRISPAVNTQTRTFAFEALAPNEEALLKPGTFARVRLETSLVEQVMTIPYGAMQYRYGVYRAFVIEGDKLTARELKTGDRVGDRMEILAGLNKTDRVAVTDVDTLTDGMKIADEGE